MSKIIVDIRDDISPSVAIECIGIVVAGGKISDGERVLVLAPLMVAGCRYKSIGVNITEATSAVIIVDKHTLDSCEYYPHYGHKGNYRFCKERKQKELEELVIKLKEK